LLYVNISYLKKERLHLFQYNEHRVSD